MHTGKIDSALKFIDYISVTYKHTLYVSEYTKDCIHLCPLIKPKLIISARLSARWGGGFRRESKRGGGASAVRRRPKWGRGSFQS